MQKYYFRTFIFSNSQIEILVSFSRSTNVNVNMSFPNIILKETLVLMCLASHYDIIETWKVNVGHRDIYYAKILNFFKCVEVRILCKKVKYVWSSHFPEAITTNMRFGNESFLFKYPDKCKQKFQNSH